MLELVVSVRNDGDTTISAPVIGWAIGPRVTSRLAYETALEEGPAFAASADTVPLPGSLGPGDAAEVPIQIDVSEISGSIDPEESGVYPLQLALRSEDGGQEIAAITTAAIHIARKPQRQVLFSWWTEIATPVAFSPDGTMIDAGFEATLEAREGIVAQVDAIADLLEERRSRAAFDLIVSPAALDQLRQAADGYERSDGETIEETDEVPRISAEILDRLRAIVSSPRVRVHAMPFAAPRLPALLSAGLRTHLEDQWRLGDETFERILEEGPDPTVARPPGLAFDQDSIDVLSARGVTTILGAADTVERPPQPNDFAPPPAAALSTTSGVDVNLLLPDPGAQALLGDAELLADPVLAAQARPRRTRHDLAGAAGARKATSSEDSHSICHRTLPAGVWSEAVERLSEAPFLKPVHADDLAFERGAGTRCCGARRPRSRGILRGLRGRPGDDRAIGSRRSRPSSRSRRTKRSGSAATAALRGGIPVHRERGIGARVDRRRQRRHRSRRSPASRPTPRVPLTFTSRSATIPLRMGDPGERVLNVKVELASGRVEFLDDYERPVRLDQANQVITFRAEVKAAGPSKIDVYVDRAERGDLDATRAAGELHRGEPDRVDHHDRRGPGPGRALVEEVVPTPEHVSSEGEPLPPDTRGSLMRHTAVMTVGTALSRLTGFLRLTAMTATPSA